MMKPEGVSIETWKRKGYVLRDGEDSEDRFAQWDEGVKQCCQNCCYYNDSVNSCSRGHRDVFPSFVCDFDFEVKRERSDAR